jgi:hypothetical protein
LRAADPPITLPARRLGEEGHLMRITKPAAAIVAAMGLMLACSTSSKEELKAPGPACEKSCDEAFDTCTDGCRVNFDNDMCEPECISVLRSCTDACR